MNKDDKKKDKTIKNWIILGVIFILCFGLTLYLCRWYQVYQEYEEQIPVIRGTLSEVSYNDFEHYVVESPTVVVYLCTADDTNCRTFEKDLKKYVDKKNYNNQIIYLNLTGVDQDSFVKEFNDKYNYKIKLTKNYPAFVIFRDGKIDSILQGNKKRDLSISKVESFLEINHFNEEVE